MGSRAAFVNLSFTRASKIGLETIVPGETGATYCYCRINAAYAELPISRKYTIHNCGKSICTITTEPLTHLHRRAVLH